LQIARATRSIGSGSLWLSMLLAQRFPSFASTVAVWIDQPAHRTVVKILHGDKPAAIMTAVPRIIHAFFRSSDNRVATNVSHSGNNILFSLDIDTVDFEDFHEDIFVVEFIARFAEEWEVICFV